MKNNKKIAILISGHLRFYKYSLDNFITNVLNPLKESYGNVDVFIHTWKSVPPEHFTSVNFGYTKSEWEEVDFNHVIKSYNPIEISIEDFNEVKDALKLNNFCDINTSFNKLWDEKIIHEGILHSTCMFYKIYKCNQLKKERERLLNFKYDYVVKYRADILCPKRLGGINQDTLYTSDFGNESCMVDDLVWLGNSEMIDYMSDIFSDLKEIYSTSDYKHDFVPEKMMYYRIINKYSLNRLCENGVLGCKIKKVGRLGIS